MLINVLKRNGDIVLEQKEIGSKLVGLRITSFVIESSEELAKLLSEEGQRWAVRNLLHSFKKIS